MAGDIIVERANSQNIGLDTAIFDRIIHELVFFIRSLKMDMVELAYLKAMAIFDAGRFDLRPKGLKEEEKVEEAKLHLWKMLEHYTRTKKPQDQTRFASLVLKLTTLRSISSAMRRVTKPSGYKHLFCDNLFARNTSHYQQAASGFNAHSNSGSFSYNGQMMQRSIKEERVFIKTEPKGYMD